MNDLLYNRKTAYIAVFLMILTSIFILGGNSLRREYTRILNVAHGQNMLGIDLEFESNLVLANSANLLVVAGRYLDASDNRIVDIRTILNEPGSASNLSDWEAGFDAMARVIPIVDDLLRSFNDMDISPASANHLTEIDSNIRAAIRRVNQSAYFSMAEDFNRTLQNPYTNLIAMVRGVREFQIVSISWGE